MTLAPVLPAFEREREKKKTFKVCFRISFSITMAPAVIQSVYIGLMMPSRVRPLLLGRWEVCGVCEVFELPHCAMWPEKE